MKGKRPMRRLFLLLAALLLTLPPTWGQALFPSECFPVERLPAALRPKAEEALLKLMDSEGLYTMVGGMKPMSSGFVSLYFSVDKPDTAKLDELRQVLSALRCGESLRCDLLTFHTPRDGKRYAEGAVFYRPAVSQMACTYADYFAPLGITSHADPLGTALIVEHLEGAPRNRGLGYLYGYPKSAVDFFVVGQEEYAITKKITPRDFRQIPTFGRESGSFVYAVPKDAPETEEDRQLKAKAGRILTEYKKRREKFVGPGRPGIVALLRDWFTNAKGECAPENAIF